MMHAFGAKSRFVTRDVNQTPCYLMHCDTAVPVDGRLVARCDAVPDGKSQKS